LELFIVAAIGIVPVLWMQLSRPFYIFAILAIALKQEQLTSQQRKILSLINTRLNRVLAVLAAVFLVGVLWQLYRVAPLATDVAPFSPEWRGLGLLSASLAFLASNLFFQIPVSVARVFVTSNAELAATEPYPLEKISPDFTILGLPVNQILPHLGDTAKTED
jgi:Mg2+/citrate symporter